MENNDSNIKPQQTGGLKLMTVFIAVLALHVVVIGGFTVYHLMSGGSTDADLTTTDKSHKSLVSADSTTVSTDTTQPDKSTTAPASTTDVASTATAPATPAATTPTPAPASTPAPAPAPTTAVSTPAVPDMSAQNATTVTTPAAPVPAPVPVPTVEMPKVPSLAPPPEVADLSSRTPTGPMVPDLAPTAEVAPAPSAPTAALASGPVGPVHMPAATSTTAMPKVTEHEHQQTYTVKITDSYKKIAKAHHVTVAELKEANHIKGDVLHTGQKLVIPSEKTAVAETTTAPASTAATAVNASLTGSELSEPTATPAPAASLAESPHSHTYTVLKGDTLSKIAHKFKTTPRAIMAENGISDPTKLTIGKKLKIPSKETRSAKNTVTPHTVIPSPVTPAPQPAQVQAKETTPTDTTTSSGELANFVP
jgi:LysM repeat protein